MDEITPILWVNGAETDCCLSPTHTVEYLKKTKQKEPTNQNMKCE